jgi:hypothetical protein
VPSWSSVLLPTVTTTSASSITASSASSGGNVTSAGIGSVTAYGVCWSTTLGSESITGSHTTDGSGTGTYTSNITSLTAGTTYYVKAYATNSAGTAYGSEINFTPTPLTVGRAYGGGIVAYLLVSGDPGYDPSVQHGLIAAASDQSTGIQWYNGSYTTTGVTATAIGTGFANTNAIITSQGAGSYAAITARSYTGGGFTDWYLPSKDELNQLYINRASIGGFSTPGYWSSSEGNNYNAWLQYFLSGFQNYVTKDYTYFVRAVRAF